MRLTEETSGDRSIFASVSENQLAVIDLQFHLSHLGFLFCFISSPPRLLGIAFPLHLDQSLEIVFLC